MKKYLGIFLCLTFLVSPAIANTVKENNYSEELNTTSVYDYVTKKIHVNIDRNLPDIDPINDSAKYIEVRTNKINELKEKQNYYIKYFALKLQSTNSSLQRVLATADTRTQEVQNSIIALHQKWLNEFAEQRSQTVDTIQEYIDKLTAEIQEVKVLLDNQTEQVGNPPGQTETIIQ